MSIIWTILQGFLEKTARIYFDGNEKRFLAQPNNFFLVIYEDQLIPTAWKNKAWLLEEQFGIYLNTVERDLTSILGDSIQNFNFTYN